MDGWMNGWIKRLTNKKESLPFKKNHKHTQSLSGRFNLKPILSS